MLLSDKSIKQELAQKRLKIEPLDASCIQPASVDLHLDEELLLFTGTTPFIDPARKDLANLLTKAKATQEQPYILKPNEFVLASTLEFIGLPEDIVAKLEGKSSLGRIGLLIHATAGFVDPGWQGKLTIQLKNVGSLPIKLASPMKICQITFIRTSTSSERPYGSEGLGSNFQGGQREI